MKIQVWGVQSAGAGARTKDAPPCSFCGRGPQENRPVLVAPGGCICRECALAAEAVLQENVPAR